MPTARIALKVISGEGRRRSRYRARASSRASSVRARLSAPEPRKGWKAKGPDRGKNVPAAETRANAESDSSDSAFNSPCAAVIDRSVQSKRRGVPRRSDRRRVESPTDSNEPRFPSLSSHRTDRPNFRGLQNASKNCFTRFCTTLGRPPQSDPFFHALSLRTARSPHHGFDPRVHAPGGSRVRPRRAAHGDRALRRRRVPPLASAGARRSLKMRFGAPKTRRNASRARARVAPRARLEIAPRARIAFPARFRALSRRFARAIASARRC
eukprot:29130-Pelagococcus_subviridis.AAC.4